MIHSENGQCITFAGHSKIVSLNNTWALIYSLRMKEQHVVEGQISQHMYHTTLHKLVSLLTTWSKFEKKLASLVTCQKTSHRVLEWYKLIMITHPSAPDPKPEPDSELCCDTVPLPRVARA